MFQFRQKVLFKHCDPAGIVFYPRYFEIINDCVEAFFDTALDCPFEKLLQTAGVPTATIQADFRMPGRHGDVLDISLWLRNLGRTSADLTLHARCGDQDRFVATSTLVYTTKQGRPQPWTAPLRAALTPYIGA